jgi:hypothetical protein
MTRIDETQSFVTMQGGPVAKARGTVASKSGVPIRGRVQASTLVWKSDSTSTSSSYPFAPAAEVDANGQFELTGLIPGERYSLIFIPNEQQRIVRVTQLATITPDAAKTIELGERSVERPRTTADQTAEFFRVREPLADRLKKAVVDARGASLHILVIIGEPDGRASESLFEYCDTELSTLNDFLQMPVGSQDAAAMAALAEDYGPEIAKLRLPALVALDGQGKLLGTTSLAPTESALRGNVRNFVAAHLPPALDAEVMMAAALAQAKRENKRVFVEETGTYCAPCRLLWRYLDRNRQILDPHFVFVRMDSSRAKRGDEVMRTYHRTKGQGIPWIVILDADGVALGDSDGKDGKNFGFPSAPTEIDRFIRLVGETAPRLTAADLEQLRSDLQRRQ